MSKEQEDHDLKEKKKPKIELKIQMATQMMSQIGDNNPKEDFSKSKLKPDTPSFSQFLEKYFKWNQKISDFTFYLNFFVKPTKEWRHIKHFELLKFEVIMCSEDNIEIVRFTKKFEVTKCVIEKKHFNKRIDCEFVIKEDCFFSRPEKKFYIYMSINDTFISNRLTVTKDEGRLKIFRFKQQFLLYNEAMRLQKKRDSQILLKRRQVNKLQSIQIELKKGKYSLMKRKILKKPKPIIQRIFTLPLRVKHFKFYGNSITLPIVFVNNKGISFLEKKITFRKSDFLLTLSKSKKISKNVNKYAQKDVEIHEEEIVFEKFPITFEIISSNITMSEMKNNSIKRKNIEGFYSNKIVLKELYNVENLFERKYKQNLNDLILEMKDERALKEKKLQKVELKLKRKTYQINRLKNVFTLPFEVYKLPILPEPFKLDFIFFNRDREKLFSIPFEVPYVDEITSKKHLDVKMSLKESELLQSFHNLCDSDYKELLKEMKAEFKRKIAKLRKKEKKDYSNKNFSWCWGEEDMKRERMYRQNRNAEKKKNLKEEISTLENDLLIMENEMFSMNFPIHIRIVTDKFYSNKCIFKKFKSSSGMDELLLKKQKKNLANLHNELKNNIQKEIQKRIVKTKLPNARSLDDLPFEMIFEILTFYGDDKDIVKNLIFVSKWISSICIYKIETKFRKELMASEIPPKIVKFLFEKNKSWRKVHMILLRMKGSGPKDFNKYGVYNKWKKFDKRVKRDHSNSIEGIRGRWDIMDMQFRAVSYSRSRGRICF